MNQGDVDLSEPTVECTVSTFVHINTCRVLETSGPCRANETNVQRLLLNSDEMDAALQVAVRRSTEIMTF